MRKVLVLGLLIAFSLPACGWGMSHSQCEDRVISQAKSPDGEYVATAYHRTCGSELSFERNYTYAEVKEVPPHFWSSPTEGRTLASFSGHRPLSVKWTGLRQLVVVTPNLKEIDPERKGIGQDTFWKHVQIHYE
jgi:hypothetical protein